MRTKRAPMGYMLVTDLGVVLYSAPDVSAAGAVVRRRHYVVSDPTGSIAVDADGSVTGWTMNAFVVGVPLAATDGSGRVDLSALGRVVAVVATALPTADTAPGCLYDFWADGNAASDRIPLPDHPVDPAAAAAKRARLAAHGPRPFPRRVDLWRAV